MESFREHIRLARRLNLPVIIHSRDAHGDTLRILREERIEQVGGVLHCFSGSWEMARGKEGDGAFISFAILDFLTNARRAQAAGLPEETLGSGGWARSRPTASGTLPSCSPSGHSK